MTSLNAVTFDTTGLRLTSEETLEDGEAHTWEGNGGDKVVLGLSRTPLQLPVAARQTPEGVLEYYARKPEAVGGTHLETLLCNVGVGPVIISMGKVPMQHHGFTYAAVVTVPFQDFSFMLRLQCAEIGTTGMREAILFDRLLASGHQPTEVDGRIVFPPGWDPDSEEHDADFPDHPASRMRNLLAQVVSSMKLDPEVHALPRYPLPLKPPADPSEPATWTTVKPRTLLAPRSSDPESAGGPAPATRLAELEGRSKEIISTAVDQAFWPAIITVALGFGTWKFSRHLMPVAALFALVVFGRLCGKLAEYLEIHGEIERETRQ